MKRDLTVVRAVLGALVVMLGAALALVLGVALGALVVTVCFKAYDAGVAPAGALAGLVMAALVLHELWAFESETTMKCELTEVRLPPCCANCFHMRLATGPLCSRFSRSVKLFNVCHDWSWDLVTPMVPERLTGHVDVFAAEGAEAFTGGGQWSDCPYSEGSDGWTGWMRGFNAAKR